MAKHFFLFLISLSSFTCQAQITWAYGEYTGTGSAQSLSGVGFQPDALMIKGNTTEEGVIVTGDMPAGEVKLLGSSTAHVTGRVTSLDSDGFTLGTDADVNSSGIEYQWIAWQDGGDCSIGTYSGTGSQVTISTIGFEPEMIWYWGDGSNSRDDAVMYLSTNSEKCDLFKSGARHVDYIGSTSASGFTTGVSTTYGHFRSGVEYYYIAFNAGSDFEVGGWSNGADVDNTDKTLSGGWQPNLVITNAAVNNLRPAFKTGTMTGDETLRFSGNTIFANAIQAINSDGFEIGTHDLAQDEWNAMDYAAMKGGTEQTLTLPINLISFDAVLVEEQVLLKWSTASEINNDYFQVERSIDGINFEVIKIVQGAGNSMDVLNYSVFDNSPPDGMVFYRIRQFDFDGQNEAFDIKSVSIGYTKGVEWIHSTVNTRNQINIYGELDGECQIRVYDLNGSIVFEDYISQTQGNSSNSILVDLPPSLSKGTYLINITNGPYTKSGKFCIK